VLIFHDRRPAQTKVYATVLPICATKMKVWPTAVTVSHLSHPLRGIQPIPGHEVIIMA